MVSTAGAVSGQASNPQHHPPVWRKKLVRRQGVESGDREVFLSPETRTKEQRNVPFQGEKGMSTLLDVVGVAAAADELPDEPTLMQFPANPYPHPVKEDGRDI
jgi:hypothetical protein